MIIYVLEQPRNTVEVKCDYNFSWINYFRLSVKFQYFRMLNIVALVQQNSHVITCYFCDCIFGRAEIVIQNSRSILRRLIELECQ